MEEVTDIEMPSPKRLRVEARDTPITTEPSDAFDDFNDIYGTPSKNEEIEHGDQCLPASAIMGESSESGPSRPILPDLPGLPGLSIFDISAPPDGIPTLSREQTLDSSLDQDITADTARGQVIGVSQPEDRSNGEKMSPDIRDLEEATKSTGTNFANVTSANDAVSFNPHQQNEAFAPHSKVFPSTTDSSRSKGEDLEDSLTSFEASLPQEAKRELGEGEARGTDVADQTGDSDKIPTFEQLAVANKHTIDAEFELDSSPLNSDSDSDSSDDTSSSDESDNDYKLLSPEEQVRRLMAEEGGSDDDGASKGRASGPLRTQNEKPDEIVPKPDVDITEVMTIEELGTVEAMVENIVVIKAKTSGEYQVLEQGSVLCLEDRSVIGVIAETLGRVQQPYYSVRFTNVTAIAEAGIIKNTNIFYVVQLSTPVFTNSLKAFKGSDASNLHDEEVGDDELEFSDDEAEAEHKRRVKMQRQQKRSGREGQNDGFSKGPRDGRGGARRGGRRGGHSHGETNAEEQMSTALETALNYDDNSNELSVDGESLYTPLARPTNLHEMMGQIAPTENRGLERNGDRANGRGRARGDRGGRGSGRGRGQGRGGFESRGSYHNDRQQHYPSAASSQQSHGFTTQSPYPQATHTGSTPMQPQPFPSYQSQFPPQWIQQPAPQHSPQPYAFQPQQSYTFPSTFAANPSTPSIPPGAHINPAFFAQAQHQLQQQQQQQQQHPHQWPPQPQQ